MSKHNKSNYGYGEMGTMTDKDKGFNKLREMLKKKKKKKKKKKEKGTMTDKDTKAYKETY